MSFEVTTIEHEEEDTSLALDTPHAVDPECRYSMVGRSGEVSIRARTLCAAAARAAMSKNLADVAVISLATPAWTIHQGKTRQKTPALIEEGGASLIDTPSGECVMAATAMGEVIPGQDVLYMFYDSRPNRRHAVVRAERGRLIGIAARNGDVVTAVVYRVEGIVGMPETLIASLKLDKRNRRVKMPAVINAELVAYRRYTKKATEQWTTDVDIPMFLDQFLRRLTSKLAKEQYGASGVEKFFQVTKAEADRRRAHYNVPYTLDDVKMVSPDTFMDEVYRGLFEYRRLLKDAEEPSVNYSLGLKVCAALTEVEDSEIPDLDLTVVIPRTGLSAAQTAFTPIAIKTTIRNGDVPVTIDPALLFEQCDGMSVIEYLKALYAERPNGSEFIYFVGTHI